MFLVWVVDVFSYLMYDVVVFIIVVDVDFCYYLIINFDVIDLNDIVV